MRCVPIKGIYLYTWSCAIPYSKRTRTFLECNTIPILKWPRNSPEMNSVEKDWNIMKKEIGSQMQCLKETWKWVCESWYSVAPNVLEELNNSMPRRILDHIKQRGLQRILILWCRLTVMFLCFHWNVFKYVVVFHWNVFKYVVVFSLECIWYSYTNVAWL